MTLLGRLQRVLPVDLDPLVGWARTGRVVPELGPSGKQKWWADHLAASQSARLVASAAGRDIVRLEAQRAGTGQWMTAPPVSQSGLCMDPAHYRALLKWHLGVPLIRGEFGGLPSAACMRPVDVFGDHAVMCKRSGFWNRHIGVQTFLCQMLTEARVPHEREVAITPGS